ncbi:MAG: hypothetical protein ACRCXD_16540, partial [Luteolibacter sp.]
KIKRAECPQALIEKGAKWTERFVASGKWPSWPQHGNRKLNHLLHDEGLRDQTKEHCSYCDITPIEPPGIETIDHFRPKSGPQGHPELAYTWENLFYCCVYCQKKKGDAFEEALLKPDEEDYEFARYFQWNFATGELMPSEVATPDDQYRAERTIDLLKLNVKLPPLRWSTRENLASRPECLDKHSYRDFLEWAFD